MKLFHDSAYFVSGSNPNAIPDAINAIRALGVAVDEYDPYDFEALDIYLSASEQERSGLPIPQKPKKKV